MERLRMDQIADIIFRLRSGQSERKVAEDTGHSRVTVHRYRERAKEAGWLDGSSLLPEPKELARILGPAPPPPRFPSTVEPLKSVVEELLDKGVEMVAIHERLRAHHGYRGSYSSVRRFVRALGRTLPQAIVRIETPPGKEAQVDFGSVGRMRDPVSGKERPAYCFVMTLSYSRHLYVEFVFDQTIPTWIGCHRRAFEHFGGVPKELVIDNLKAAVLQHELEDPILSAPYRRMALHYGCLIHPCRPRTPRHKGKVESGVHYVKRNFLAAETFLDIEDANGKAGLWVKERAGMRTHGTTREAPLLRFAREKDELMPLPSQPFALMAVRRVKVGLDCHVTIEGGYYSAPSGYVGKTLEAHLYERTVQLFDGVELVFTHPKAQRPGERITHPGHYPRSKAIYLERTPAFCKEQAQSVGPGCHQVVTGLLDERPADHLRAAQSLVALIEKVGKERLEAACLRALHFGDPRYRRIKGILAAGLESEPLPGHKKEAPAPPVFAFARKAEEFFAKEGAAA